MDRFLIVLSTGCYLAAVVRTALTLRNGLLHRGYFNLLAVAAGFFFKPRFFPFVAMQFIDVPSRICLRYSSFWRGRSRLSI